jgi:itaconyl-CoA hydratase
MRLTGTDNYFEDFVVGDVYLHVRGKTITEADNTIFTLSSLNTAQAHVNTEYSRELFVGYPERLVNGAFTVALAVGLTAQDIAENSIADVSMTDIRIASSLFHGDTLYAKSTILATDDSDDHADCGVLRYRIDAFKKGREAGADDIPVMSGERTILVKRRDAWKERDTTY